MIHVEDVFLLIKEHVCYTRQACHVLQD
jgi:hypothetical protein